MYNDKYFYGITDLMHFNVYASLLKEHIIREERVIIKVFKKENEVVVVENNNMEDDSMEQVNKLFGLYNEAFNNNNDEDPLFEAINGVDVDE